MTHSSQGWHPADIKAAVQKAGSTMTDIALKAGLHPSALSHALRWPVPAANRAIAAFLGVPLHELWPEWFDEDGEPKPRDRKPITAPDSAHSQKRSAA